MVLAVAVLARVIDTEAITYYITCKVSWKHFDKGKKLNKSDQVYCLANKFCLSHLNMYIIISGALIFHASYCTISVNQNTAFKQKTQMKILKD